MTPEGGIDGGNMPDLENFEKQAPATYCNIAPKKLRLKATVDLGEVVVNPDTPIQIQGLHIDGKFK